MLACCYIAEPGRTSTVRRFMCDITFLALPPMRLVIFTYEVSCSLSANGAHTRGSLHRTCQISRPQPSHIVLYNIFHHKHMHLPKAQYDILACPFPSLQTHANANGGGGGGGGHVRCLLQGMRFTLEILKFGQEIYPCGRISVLWAI